jgi:hypothetical protein
MKSFSNNLKSSILAWAGFLVALITGCNQGGGNGSNSANSDTLEYYTADDFTKLVKYDTHIHFDTFDTTLLELARQQNFKFLTINVNAPSSPALEDQQKVALELIKLYPENLAYATSFYAQDFDDPQWQAKSIAYLKSSFDKGARAVKIWKNVGMEFRNGKGQFIMIDDPKFDPVLDFIEKNNATLIGHIGEPRNAWLPDSEMTVKNDKRYFKKHPQYHMYLHPEFPHHSKIMAARDHMLEKHQGLTFVGAHLGSLEWDVDVLAEGLDKYPNMAVDMAARIGHFQYQTVENRDKVRQFFIKYQDRIVYATDNTISDESAGDALNTKIINSWAKDWAYFTSDSKMNVPDVDGEFTGLHLPKSVIDKIYTQNAKKWFPGLAALEP